MCNEGKDRDAETVNKRAVFTLGSLDGEDVLGKRHLS